MWPKKTKTPTQYALFIQFQLSLDCSLTSLIIINEASSTVPDPAALESTQKLWQPLFLCARCPNGTNSHNNVHSDYVSTDTHDMLRFVIKIEGEFWSFQTTLEVNLKIDKTVDLPTSLHENWGKWRMEKGQTNVDTNTSLSSRSYKSISIYIYI